MIERGFYKYFELFIETLCHAGKQKKDAVFIQHPFSLVSDIQF